MFESHEPIKSPLIQEMSGGNTIALPKDTDEIAYYIAYYIEEANQRYKSLGEEYNSIIDKDIKERYNKKITAESYINLNIPNDTKEKKDLFEQNIVITIDDCYNYNHTRSLFQTLKEKNLTATFFPNTRYLNLEKEDTVKLWREIYEEGFEIGYHTTNHVKGMSVEELNQDFEAFTQHMRALLGDSTFTIKTVRPPYGSWNEQWNNWVKQNDLFNVRWNMDPTLEASHAETLKEQGISPIVILHSRWEDVDWLNRNVQELLNITKEDNGIVGSVYNPSFQKRKR